MKQAVSPTKHASIVIFTYDAEAADKCIRLGLNINYRNYPVEKYAPHLRITQCYKCHKYGHHAQHCRSKLKCGKCSSEEHITSECPSPIAKCLGCNGEHAAWDSTCPAREEEIKRLSNIRKTISQYYLNEP